LREKEKTRGVKGKGFRVGNESAAACLILDSNLGIEKFNAET